MAKWIGINTRVHGNADGFGMYYVGSAQDKKNRRKRKAWEKQNR